MHCKTILPQTPRATILPPTPRANTPTFPTRITFPTRTQTRTLKVKAQATKVNEGKTKTGVTEMSFYELLGIPQSGSLPDIKQAYKELVLMYHPDVSPPERVVENTERFIRVQLAYETLSDPTSRAVYDRALSSGLNFAFSARSTVYQDSDVKNDWKIRWQSQLSELKNRSMYKDEQANMSWGARMRRQKNESC